MKECNIYKHQLQKAHELSEKLKKQIRSLDKSNVVRRLATIEQHLQKERAETLKLKDEVDELKNEIQRFNEDLIEKRRLTKKQN